MPIRTQSSYRSPKSGTKPKRSAVKAKAKPSDKARAAVKEPSESRIDRISTTAIRLFVERGFHDTPTSLIAREAGVANGTLFHHYPSKEILINSLYLEVNAQLAEASSNGLDALTDFPDRLSTTWHNTLHWALEHPRKIEFVLQFSHSPYLDRMTLEQSDAMTVLYINLLKEGSRKGFLVKAEPELLYVMTIQQLYGLVKFLADAKAGAKRNNLIRKAYEIFVRSISK